MLPPFTRRLTLAHGLSLTCAIMIALPPALRACQICIPYPKKSAAEFLLESDTVVLAREDPERPFHFHPVAVLKGAAPEEKIDLFLDSATRRLLTAFPERACVLAGNSIDAGMEWRRLGVADTEFGPVVREILQSAGRWQKAPRDRVEFFAARLGHKNPQVRALAHLEVARAPYNEIVRLRDALTREEIHAFLANARYVEWHPLYILLLSKSEHVDDRTRIDEAFRSAARFGTTTCLSAWATASIELEEAAAIDFIEENYFRNANRKPEELKAVLQALSVHGFNGHVHLRDRIIEAHSVLLDTHPEMTPRVVTDLTAWKRFDLAEPVARIAAARPPQFDFQTTLRLRAYARGARAK